MIKTPMKKPSPQNQAVADFMREFLKENDRLPAINEIATHFNYSNSNAAACHIKRLVGLGILEPSGRGHHRFKRPPPPPAKREIA